MKLLILTIALVVAMPLASFATTIDLHTPTLGSPSPGVVTFTGNGLEGFSAINWSGWIGTASGPGGISGVYSFQGAALTAGAPIVDMPGVEVWMLGGGPDTFWFNDTKAHLGTPIGDYLQGNIVFQTLSCLGGANCMLTGFLTSTSGSMGPVQGNVPILLDLKVVGIDLSKLRRGAKATAQISVGELIMAPEPASFLLCGIGLIGVWRRRQ